jgi:hypothetical protein
MDRLAKLQQEYYNQAVPGEYLYKKSRVIRAPREVKVFKPPVIEEEIPVSKSATPAPQTEIEEQYEVPPVAPTPEPREDEADKEDIKEEFQENDPVSKIVNVSETTAWLPDEYEDDFDE